MKWMRMLMLLTALTTLTACDYLDRGEYRKEREDRDYQTAMDDYRAGRLAQAVRGLKKVCAGNPANSSARFQLACLLQDFEKDSLAALCAYNEFLQQRPHGEKEALARSRLAACEKLLAGELAAKYGLDNEQAAATRIHELEQKLAAAEKHAAEAAKDLETANRRIAALTHESDRLRRVVKADDDDTARKSDVSEALALLAEDDEEARKSSVPVLSDKDLLDNDEPSESEPIARSEATTSRRAAEKKNEHGDAAKKADSRNARPDSYVVQEGDTLYKIAVRFYGRASAWSAIRDANKAIISNDGRVNAGQKIVLPK